MLYRFGDDGDHSLGDWTRNLTSVLAEPDFVATTLPLLSMTSNLTFASPFWEV